MDDWTLIIQTMGVRCLGQYTLWRCVGRGKCVKIEK